MFHDWMFNTLLCMGFLYSLYHLFGTGNNDKEKWTALIYVLMAIAIK